MTDRILVVDDEEGIRDIIKEYLSPHGYVVDEAANGLIALELLEKNKYALVVLDIMMPKMDGWSLLRELRKSSNLPAIMLSARGEEYDKILGFELGADDYVVKPFSPKELLVRIRAIIRRSAPPLSAEETGEKRSFGGLSVELDSRSVYIDGKKAELTPKEFELLAFLVRHPDKVFSRDQLLNEVWGYDYFGDDRTVDTHIKMLRGSIGPYRKHIVTVWGIGYKFEAGVKS